jgi:hypothetical protein
MMASEKYLLDEFSPELRDAFEEHYFGCTECARDVQMGAAFIDHAKSILPEMERSAAAKPPGGKRNWVSWLSTVLGPVVMAPVFACLLAIVGYQNLVVLPALEASASAPQVLPAATVLHDETRGGLPVVHADLKLGSTVSVEVPASAYDTYKFEFFNSKGKVIRTVIVPGANRTDDMVSVWLPGNVKQDTYKLVISGITPSGGTVAVKQQTFTLQNGK